MGLKPNARYPYKRKERDIRDTEMQREGHVRTEAESGFTMPRVHRYWVERFH